MTFEVRPVRDEDRSWVRELIEERWVDEFVVGHGVVSRPAELDGFLAMEGSDVVGLATYRIEGGACEIVTIDALVEGRGVGSTLVEAVHERAHRAGCAGTRTRCPLCCRRGRRSDCLAAGRRPDCRSRPDRGSSRRCRRRCPHTAACLV